MLLDRIARCWSDVSHTRSRSAKVQLLADVLGELAPDELEPGTAMLAGEFRQGRIGVGWRTVEHVDVPAATSPTLTVAAVDQAIAAIAAVTGSGSTTIRKELLDQLWSRATRDEQDLLAHLMLGSLRQGALEGVVVQAVAAAADVDLALMQRATMLTGDVTTSAVMAMIGGQEELSAVGLEVMRGVQPMLASSAPDVEQALAATGPAHVETKLDGMRIQVHRREDDITVFTRSLREVSDGLPDVVEAARSLQADSFILDGEALAMTADGRPRPFQESMRSDRLQPFFFDVLHLDGADLIDEPLATRRARLTRLVPPELLVDGVATDDPGPALAHLRAALAAGHEGVVVKADSAVYEAGRRGASWVKVKVAHTLDLVVLAVEWGSGRRKGWLSNLHLGALDEDTGQFVMLGKTFKGMTDEMLAWQTQHLLEIETEREGHVVQVRPELVVEIAFDGVQASRRYPGGVALRFARVKRYRTDKQAADADSLQTVQAIHRGEITATV